MSDNDIIVGLTTIVVLGLGAQWVARRRDFPSLLLLLPLGLIAGDGLGLVEPEKLFGETLFPGVTLLVGLLLFHSGLQLRFRDLPRDAKGPVVRLVTIGAAITFLAGSSAVFVSIGESWRLSVLVGAILVVSGPTVVGPLLRVVRAKEPSASVLSWEGTTLDPVGATLAVVVLNLVLADQREGLHPALQMLVRLVAGIGVGGIAALILVFVMSRFLVTDDMEPAVAILLAVAAFGCAELIASEAGLFATVTLGIVAANQRIVETTRIEGVGGTIEAIIVGSLFIVLGALVNVDDLVDSAPRILALVALLVLVVRPLSVGLSMIRSRLTGRQRGLVSWVDPRGVVAVSVAASSASSLDTVGIDGSFLLPTTFGVVLGTGVIYGLTAAPMASWLGQRRSPPMGVCLVGNDGWIGDLAACLGQHGAQVLVITSSSEVEAADRRANLRTVALTDGGDAMRRALEDADVAKALVAIPAGMTENIVTSLFTAEVGRRHVYRLVHGAETAGERAVAFAATAHAFGRGITDADIEQRVAAGARVRPLVAEDEGVALPLAAISPDGHVNFHPADDPPSADHVVIGMAAR